MHNVKSIRELLLRLRVEIGLSEDDVMLIIFTSLNSDYLNNLLVLAGEFLKWFNLNYEGESRDEIDFKDNKTEIWLATADMATLIVQEFDHVRAEPQSMLAKSWWEYLRYRAIGEKVTYSLS
mmetsp:Transcript_6749/g.10852  ORF Transcript_6749/g.10852 Transcript_6749/m.10852 type:complete len:122 (-) Transcript_6749:1015-1380(-)